MKYTLTAKNLTFVHQGEVYCYSNNQRWFEEVVAALKKGNELAPLLLKSSSWFLESSSEGQISAVNGYPSINGVTVRAPIVDYIIQYLLKQLPLNPLLKFLKKLSQYPIQSNLDRLFKDLNFTLSDEGNLFGVSIWEEALNPGESYGLKRDNFLYQVRLSISNWNTSKPKKFAEIDPRYISNPVVSKTVWTAHFKYLGIRKDWSSSPTLVIITKTTDLPEEYKVTSTNSDIQQFVIG